MIRYRESPLEQDITMINPAVHYMDRSTEFFLLIQQCKGELIAAPVLRQWCHMQVYRYLACFVNISLTQDDMVLYGIKDITFRHFVGMVQNRYIVAGC